MTPESTAALSSASAFAPVIQPINSRLARMYARSCITSSVDAPTVTPFSGVRLLPYS